MKTKTCVSWNKFLNLNQLIMFKFLLHTYKGVYFNGRMCGPQPQDPSSIPGTSKEIFWILWGRKIFFPFVMI